MDGCPALWSGLLWCGMLGGLAAVEQGAAQSIHVARFQGDRLAAVSYTFDDGWEDAASIAAPMFERHGLRATFFIVSGVLAEDEPPQGKNHYDKVPWKRWRQIAMNGHEIGNHSFDHAQHFTDADDDKLRFQIVGGHDLIRDRIGIAPISFALPSSNTLTPWTRAVIDSCHLLTREGAGGFEGKKCTISSANARVDEAIAKQRWLIPLFHAVENGYDAFSSAAVLDGHLAYVSTMRDRVWVDTFGHVGLYVKERDAAKLESTATVDGVTFTLITTLDPLSYHAPLTVVIPVSGVTIAQANRTDQEASLPIIVKPDRVLVEVVPGPLPVTVHWRTATQTH